MKDMNLEQCTEIIEAIAKKYGVAAIAVKTNARMCCGTFKVVWVISKKAWDEQSPKIFLADHIWSGEYRNKKKRYTARMDVTPAYRLMVVLHECAHMVLWATQKNAYRSIPAHGLLFKDALKALCRDHGYKPVFSDPLSAKVVSLVDLNTGEAHRVDPGWKVERW